MQRSVIEARRGRRPTYLTSLADVMTYLGDDVVLTAEERQALQRMIGDDDRRFYGEGQQKELVRDIRAHADARRVFAVAAAARTQDVLVQGDYMSGDRFGIAASLLAARQLRQTLGVVLLHAPGNEGTANDMRAFYERSLKGSGAVPVIELVPVGSPQHCYRALRPLLEGQRKVHSATFGTELVKRAQSASPHDFQQQLVDRWRGSDQAAAPVEAKLREWLVKIGMVPGAYALMWVKTGAMSAEKSHHFTNRVAWEGLIERVRNETARVPVLIGEDLKLTTKPHLGKFWDHPEFPAELKAEGRMGQLRLFMMLAKSVDYDVVSVGMRSGAMEGPALVGVPTIYLEEAGNEQAERMEKWLAALPNFFRVIIDRPPGGAQMRAWTRDTVLRINEKAARLLAEREVKSAGYISRGIRERIDQIDRELQQIEVGLRGFDDTLRISLYEGLRPDEQEEILRLVKLTRRQIVAGHADLLEPGTRRRAKNRPDDPVEPFSAEGMKEENNEALRLYLRFADWVVTRGPPLGPAVPDQANGLVREVVEAVRAVPKYGALPQWLRLENALGKARAGRVHGQHAASLHRGLDGSIAAFDTRVQNKGRTAGDLIIWRGEPQPTGVVTRRNEPTLRLLLSALEQPPLNRGGALAKWSQVRDLMNHLSALELDGPAAANHRTYGHRLRDLTRAAQVEMFTSDDLPPHPLDASAARGPEGEVAKVT